MMKFISFEGRDDSSLQETRLKYFANQMDGLGD